MYMAGIDIKYFQLGASLDTVSLFDAVEPWEDI